MRGAWKTTLWGLEKPRKGFEFCSAQGVSLRTLEATLARPLVFAGYPRKSLRRPANAALLLDQRRRRWPNNKATLARPLVFVEVT